MTTPTKPGDQSEHQYHRYLGSEIPWYVHLLWMGFWILAIVYLLLYFVPAIQVELKSPP